MEKNSTTKTVYTFLLEKVRSKAKGSTYQCKLMIHKVHFGKEKKTKTNRVIVILLRKTMKSLD